MPSDQEPASTGPSPGTAQTAKMPGLLALLGLVVVFSASIWLRWPGFSQGGFASHDVAGILYNGMVLARGGLPYVDTVELKAPGGFYAAWLFAGEGARDIGAFQMWANAWAVMALLAVAATGWRMWGPRGAVAAAAVYALHDAHLDSMDANYVTWANLPAVLAAAHGLAALDLWDRTDQVAGRRRLLLWFLAGLLAGVAILMKRPAGVVLLSVVAWATWEAFARDGAPAPAAGPAAHGARPTVSLSSLSSLGGVLAGVVVAQLPVMAHYAAHGQLQALWAGFYGSQWGAHYVAAGTGRLPLGRQLVEGGLATAYFLGLGLFLAAFALARGGTAGARGNIEHGKLELEGRRRVALLVWALLCVGGAWVGFRFYKGYFLVAAAPLALLAAAPGGLLAAWPRRERAARVLLVGLSVALVVRQAGLSAATRADRARAHDLGGRAIATHVLEHSEPDDTIWVWGWHLWDVYPLTGQMSGSRIYKSIGLLTPPNDDSWRRPATKARFADGPASQLLMEDLRRTRPRYIVFGSTVPARDFGAMQAFLKAHYVRDRRVRLGRVQFWRRRTEPESDPSQPWSPGLHGSVERELGGTP